MNISKVSGKEWALIVSSLSLIFCAIGLVCIYLKDDGYIYLFLATICIVIASYLTLSVLLRKPSTPIARYKDAIELSALFVVFFLLAPILIPDITDGLRTLDDWLSAEYHISGWHLHSVIRNKFLDDYFISIYSTLVLGVMGYLCRGRISRFLEELTSPPRLTVSLPLMISAAPVLRLKDQYEKSKTGIKFDYNWFFAGKSALVKLSDKTETEPSTDIAIVSDMALLGYLDEQSDVRLDDLQYIPFCKITGHIKLLEYNPSGENRKGVRPKEIFHFRGSVHEDYLKNQLKYTIEDLKNMQRDDKLLVKSTFECVRGLINDTKGNRGAVLAWEPHYVMLKNLHQFSEIAENDFIPNGQQSAPYEWTLCMVARSDNSKVEKFKYEIQVGLSLACRQCEKEWIIDEVAEHMPSEISGVEKEDLKKLSNTNGGDEIVYGIEGATRALISKLRVRRLGNNAGEWARILEREKSWFGYKLIDNK